MKKKKVHTVPSCGNIFKDLGLPDSDKLLAEVDADIISRRFKRAESKENKKEIIKRILDIWVDLDCLRLGQLLDDALVQSDLFFIEDYDLIEKLEKFYRGGTTIE